MQLIVQWANKVRDKTQLLEEEHIIFTIIQ